MGSNEAWRQAFSILKTCKELFPGTPLEAYGLALHRGLLSTAEKDLILRYMPFAGAGNTWDDTDKAWIRAFKLCEQGV